MNQPFLNGHDLRRIVRALEWRQDDHIQSASAAWSLVMMTFLIWCLLFVFCWPVAILALLLYPIVWLVLLPFRLVGIAVGGVFEFLHALLTLPARALHRLA